MLVNFMGFNLSSQKNSKRTPVQFQGNQSAIKYSKNLTKDTVSFTSYPGKKESELLEGLKHRNPRRLVQLENEGFHYQSPLIPEAIEALEQWRADTEHSDPDLSWKLGEQRAILQYKASPQFLEDCRAVIAY